MTEKSFVDLGREIGQLLEAKNLAYGNSFERSEDIIKILYPDGIPVQAYRDALALIRVIDKCFRIANAKGAFGEDPWRDIAGYSILSLWSEAKRRAAPGAQPELKIDLTGITGYAGNPVAPNMMLLGGLNADR
jgi:hypothetical protein